MDLPLGILNISRHFLLDRLNLPSDIIILDIQPELATDNILIKICHNSIPYKTREGNYIIRVRPIHKDNIFRGFE